MKSDNTYWFLRINLKNQSHKGSFLSTDRINKHIYSSRKGVIPLIEKEAICSYYKRSTLPKSTG